MRPSLSVSRVQLAAIGMENSQWQLLLWAKRLGPGVTQSLSGAQLLCTSK